MNANPPDRELDALLAEMLAPADRPPDEAFVTKVDWAVAEHERYRRKRAQLWRQLSGEALAIAALAGSLALIAQVPAVRAALVELPFVAWPALMSLLVLWLIVMRRAPKTLT